MLRPYFSPIDTLRNSAYIECIKLFLSGSQQIYAWETPRGELRQLTTHTSNILVSWISPTGQHIYFLNDWQGNEQGHLTRVPFEGGEFEDVTPNLPL